MDTLLGGHALFDGLGRSGVSDAPPLGKFRWRLEALAVN
jgi:hypothetical protein